MASFESVIEEAFQGVGTDTPYQTMTVGSIKGAVNKRIKVDMDEQACSEALSDLDSYYKVCQLQLHSTVGTCL